MASTEKFTQKAIHEYLLLKGHYVWRNNTGCFKRGSDFIHFGKVGSSDLIGIANDGRMIAIECKDIKGKTTEAQDFFLEEIQKRGGYAVVARSLDDVMEAGL